MNNWTHYNGQHQGYPPNQPPQQPPYYTDNYDYNNHIYNQAPPSQFQQYPPQPVQQQQQQYQQQYQQQQQHQFQQQYQQNYQQRGYQQQNYQQQNYQPPMFNFETPMYHDQWTLPQQAPQQMLPQMFHQHQQPPQQHQAPVIPIMMPKQTVSSPAQVKSAPVPSSAATPTSTPTPQKRAKVRKPKPTGPSPNVLKEQALVDLSNKLYNHAVSQRSKITTEKNIQEYFTLVKLSIVALQQVIKMKQKTSLRLRVKCNIRIAQILSNEADMSSLRETPDVYLDEAVLLCGDSPDLKTFKYQAELALIQYMISQKKLKQALKTIGTSKFNETSVYKFFKFTVQKSLDPVQAHQTITQLIQSIRASTNSPVSKETLEYIELTEISHSLEFGLTPLSTFNNITPSTQDLILYKNLLIVLYEIQYKSSINQTSNLNITTSLKLINDIITQKRQSQSSTPPDPIKLTFQFDGQDMVLEVHMADPLRLYITFFIIFAVSGMNSTFEKRKSQKLLQMAGNELSTSLEINGPRTSLKDHQERHKSFQELSSLVTFFSFIESTIADEAGEDSSKKAANAVYTQCSDPILVNYAMALGYHLRGEVDSAMKTYLALAHEMEITSSSMCKYSDLYMIICLNLSGAIESQICHYSSVQDVTKVSELMVLRAQANEKLGKIRSASNTSFRQRYLFDTTSKFLEILYNPNSVSIFEIIERIDKILVDQERLKSYPLLLSMLLYIKSSTLNNNSDQKQKSSQSAFNLAKMGYSPLIRYVTGLLNQQNAALARNDQQLEIQKQKLIKVENKIRFKFANMFQS